MVVVVLGGGWCSVLLDGLELLELDCQKLILLATITLSGEVCGQGNAAATILVHNPGCGEELLLLAMVIYVRLSQQALWIDLYVLANFWLLHHAKHGLVNGSARLGGYSLWA